MSREPIAIDLFSGCGGLSQGLRDADFNVIAAVEIEPFARETYALNHPEVQLFEDITKINTLSMKRKLRIRKGQLDLLAGCPPCQGFTTLRTLNGKREIADPRNDLVLEFIRFVQDFLPKAVMFENVPRLKNDSRFKLLLDELDALGYKADWDILNAADFGVPQRRRRLILIATRRGIPKLDKQDRPRSSVQAVIKSLLPAGRSGDPLHDLPENRSEDVVRRISMIPKDGGSRLDLSEDEQLDCHRGFDGFKDIYGRMAWDSVAPTITSGCTNPSKGRFLHPVEDRAITLREASLLQGFPAEYRFPTERGKSAVAVMIGNALPPAMAEVQARHLAQMAILP